MIKDQRKFRRRQIRYTAWLALSPGELHGCVLSDVSDSGARLDVEDSRKVPDRFSLFLASKGTARRHCRVVWRKPTQIGVKFVRARPAADEATLVPALDAGNDMPKAKDKAETTTA